MAKAGSFWHSGQLRLAALDFFAGKVQAPTRSTALVKTMAAIAVGRWESANSITKAEDEYLAKPLKPVRILGGTISIE